MSATTKEIGRTTSAGTAQISAEPKFEQRAIRSDIKHHAGMQTSDGDTITIARGVNDVPPIMLAVAGDGSGFSVWMTEAEAAATGRELLAASGAGDDAGAAGQPSIPAGFALVPIEPTQAMLDAALATKWTFGRGDEDFEAAPDEGLASDVWAAMLFGAGHADAAPQPAAADAAALREQRDALLKVAKRMLDHALSGADFVYPPCSLQELEQAVAQCGEAPAASGAAQQTEPVVTIKRAAWQEFERLFDRGVSKGWIPQEDLIELYNALDPVSGGAQ